MSEKASPLTLLRMVSPQFTEGTRKAVDQCLEHTDGPCQQLTVYQDKERSTITVTVTIKTDLGAYKIGSLVTA